MNSQNVFYQKWLSPVGDIFIYSNQTELMAVTFPANNRMVLKSICTTQPLEKNTPVIEQTVCQLQEYFSGRRKQFDITLNPAGTAFQKLAWSELCNIPFGQTSTYGQQAKKIKSPQSARAVGTANGRNPISIIVPCHRVIGANGKISGYAGGPKIKAALLALERGEKVL